MLQAEGICAAYAFYLVIKCYYVEVESEENIHLTKCLMHILGNSSSSSPFEFPQATISCRQLYHSGRMRDTSTSVNQIFDEINIAKSFMLNGDGYETT